MSGDSVSLGARLVFGTVELVSALLYLVLIVVGIGGGGVVANMYVVDALGVTGDARGGVMLGGAAVGFVVGLLLGSKLRKGVTRRKAYYYTWEGTYAGEEGPGPVSFAVAGGPGDLPGVDEAELLAEIAGQHGFDGDIDDAIDASDDFAVGGDGDGGGGFDGGGGGGE